MEVILIMVVVLTVTVGRGVTMDWDGATLNKKNAFIHKARVAVMNSLHVKNHESAIRIKHLRLIL